jgi:uracil-DNA glycosylase
VERHITLAPGADLAGFRSAARQLVRDRVAPEQVNWNAVSEPGLFADAISSPAPAINLPQTARDLIELVVCHRDNERYALLYEMIWRIADAEPALLEVKSDPLVHQLERMAKSVRRDLHKMHAFLRFRRIGEGDGHERFIAWFEPDHYILEATAQFFVDRFRSVVWSIVTPVGTLHWDRSLLVVGPPGTRSDCPSGDAFEEGWSTYYESVFNPARLNLPAMRAEMAKKYWKNMPETAGFKDMIRTAPERARTMIEREAGQSLKRTPEKALLAMTNQDPQTLEELNRIIARSEPFVEGGTRAVLGEGPIGARIAFVGEQPGDQEDLQGHPFVGPAGQLLDRALEEADIDRKKTYVTNAVKHFKFEQRGKRRLHQKPTAGEVKRYRGWLKRELELVHPSLVVALGATAVLALAGKALPVSRSRGKADFDGQPGYITVHPSYLLRLPDEAARRQAYAEFVSDLKKIRVLAA